MCSKDVLEIYSTMDWLIFSKRGFNWGGKGK